jgi:hypothetical protein
MPNLLFKSFENMELLQARQQKEIRVVSCHDELAYLWTHLAWQSGDLDCRSFAQRGLRLPAGQRFVCGWFREILLPTGETSPCVWP